MKSIKQTLIAAAILAAFAVPATPALAEHGGHHIQEIQQLQGKQYAEEAQTWDAMKKHMYGIAGALAKQFPAKFV